jgi:hypothetical protein
MADELEVNRRPSQVTLTLLKLVNIGSTESPSFNSQAVGTISIDGDRVSHDTPDVELRAWLDEMFQDGTTLMDPRSFKTSRGTFAERDVPVGPGEPEYPAALNEQLPPDYAIAEVLGRKG